MPNTDRAAWPVHLTPPSTLRPSPLSARLPKYREPRPAKSHAVLLRAAAEEGILLTDLVGTSHRRECVAARRRAAIELREMGYSFPRIGRLLNRHHTSIFSLIGGAQAAPKPAFDPDAPDLSGEWAI